MQGAKQSDGPPRRRSRRPSPSDGELLDRAFNVFVEMGYEGASIAIITHATGVAKRTLYLRYGDKEGLFKAALEQAIERFVVPPSRLREAESEDLGETFLEIGRMLVENILSSSGLRLLHLTNVIAWRMPELAASNVHLGVGSTLSFLTDLLDRRLGDRLMWFSSAEDAATAFINLVVCGPATWISQGVLLDRQFVRSYVEASVAAFLQGIQRPQAAEISCDNDSGRDLLLAENERLKILLAEAIMQIDQMKSAGKSNFREETVSSFTRGMWEKTD